MYNNEGINVEVGRKYEFHSLYPDRKDVCKVTGFIYNEYGTCYGVRVLVGGILCETRWLNWAIKEV